MFIALFNIKVVEHINHLEINFFCAAARILSTFQNFPSILEKTKQRSVACVEHIF